MHKGEFIMKKVGLAVCYDTKNFGSQLQVLATIKKVEDLGHETEIIQYKKKLTPIFVLQTIPRLFNVSFVKAKLHSKNIRKQIEKHQDIAKSVSVRNGRFNQFVEKHFTNLSKPYKGWENLVRESAKKYDVFLCGSDQLWLPNNLGSHFYTLEFAPDDKPKIAYATSFGVSQIPERQKKATAKYLNRFQHLSTRELAGQKIIQELTGKKASVVCDPTLLFDANSWKRIIPDRRVIDEPYVFCYFLGTNEEHRKAANELKKKTGLKLVTCPYLDNFVERDQQFGDIQMFDIDAADFVNLIRHAEYILTDSFHGSVFSILHHKKFMTFNRFTAGTNSRNSRIDSLCTLLGLSERRFNGNVMDVKNDVDYVGVEERLSKLRVDSIKYLENALK